MIKLIDLVCLKQQSTMSLKIHRTKAFAVLDFPNVNVNNDLIKDTEKGKTDKVQRAVTRANQEHGDRMANAGLIGGEFTVTQSAAFVSHRLPLFDQLWDAQELAKNSMKDEEI